MKLTIPKLLAEIRATAKLAAPARPNKNWRAEWVKQVGRCQNPECQHQLSQALNRLTVHEICCGAHRKEAVKHRECCLVLCYLCNSMDFTNYVKWPISRQLALKLVTDAAHFDLVKANRIRGRDDNAITLADVVKFLKMTH